MIQASIEVGQLAMVEAHLVENRCVQIANVPAIDGRLVAKLIGFAVRHPAFDSAAG